MKDDQTSPDPFGPTASASIYVPREATEEAFAVLQRAVLEEGRVALIEGPAGLGKTLLLRRLEEAARERFRPLYLPYVALSPEELCHLILQTLSGGSVDLPTKMLAAWIGHLQSEDSALVLLLDDATALPGDTARWLSRMLDESKGGLRLALGVLDPPGSPELRVLSAKAERIRLVAPMSLEETRAYLEARLEIGGVKERSTDFDARVIERLHRISRGNPRRLHWAADVVLRGADPAATAAFLDGVDPEHEARADAAPSEPARKPDGASKPRSRPAAEEASLPQPKAAKPAASKPEADETTQPLRPKVPEDRVRPPMPGAKRDPRRDPETPPKPIQSPSPLEAKETPPAMPPAPKLAKPEPERAAPPQPEQPAAEAKAPEQPKPAPPVKAKEPEKKQPEKAKTKQPEKPETKQPEKTVDAVEAREPEKPAAPPEKARPSESPTPFGAVRLRTVAVPSMDSDVDLPADFAPVPPPPVTKTETAAPPPAARTETAPAPRADARKTASDALRAATEGLREATSALGAPGVASAADAVAFRDAIAALRGAIAAAQAAAGSQASQDSAPRAQSSRGERSLPRFAALIGLLAVAGVVGGLLLGSLLKGPNEGAAVVVEKPAPAPTPAVVEVAPSNEPEVIEPLPPAPEPEPVVAKPVPVPPAPEPVLPEPQPLVRERTPPQPAAPEPALAIHRIGINATPWATIVIDGKEVGETPLAGVALTEGVHRVEAHLPDGRIVERQVRVGPDTRSLVFP